MDNPVVLQQTLAVAVPLWILRVRTWTPARRRERSQACAQVVAEHGDMLMFKTKATTKHPIGSKEAFNALAEGLALLSFSPGGVKFLGERWETVEPQEAR